MKLTYFISILSLLFFLISCDKGNGGKWWGERRIAEIEGTNDAQEKEK